MIQLNVDYFLLNKFFGIPQSRIVKYANKDLKEIMELEAQQGNKKAQEYKNILSDPNKIKDIFKLANTENKYKILKNMSEGDIDNLLPFLKEEQLAMGLNFFTEEKLMEMAGSLPIVELCGMIFEKFKISDVVKLMPENSINKFLMQPDVERRYLQNYINTLDKKTMEKMMMRAFGQEFEGKDKSEYKEHLTRLKDDEFDEFILSLQPKMKMNLIGGAIEQDESLMLLFQPQDMLKPMEMLMREEKVQMMSNLDSEFLVPMIQELPIDLTQIVLTQIDSKDFSEILAKNFSNILSSVVLFSDTTL